MDNLERKETIKKAQAIASQHLNPLANHHDLTGDFPVENFENLGKSGLLGFFVPKEYGGLEGDFLAFAQAVEILAKSCASTAMMYVMHNMQYFPLVVHGTKQQKDFFLPDIAQGKSLIGSGTTEPETGGNILYCNSYRTKVDDQYSLSVKKPIVSGAKYVDWVFCTTRVSQKASTSELCFLILPGIKNQKSESIKSFGEWNCIGMRATASIGLEYQDCRVPEWHALGENDFLATLLSSMTPTSLIGYSAVWLGIAQGALDVAIQHAVSRTHSTLSNNVKVETSIANYDTLQRQVAEMNVQIESVRGLLHSTAQLIDEKRKGPTDPVPPYDPELNSKVFSTRVAASAAAIDVSRIALRICGVKGMIKGLLPLERYMRDALTSQVMGSGEDAMKLILGKQLLGLLGKEPPSKKPS